MATRELGIYAFHCTSCIYKGEMGNGVAEGKGVVYYPDKYGVALYKGEFHHGDRHGRGILFLEDGITKYYEGEWANDQIEGKGIMFWPDGITPSFEGYFHDGNYEGHGIVYDENGQKKFEGNFHQSDYHGKGSLFRNGEKVYEGLFSFGQMTYGAIFQNGLKVYEGILPPTEDGIVEENVPFNQKKDVFEFIISWYSQGIKDPRYYN